MGKVISQGELDTLEVVGRLRFCLPEQVAHWLNRSTRQTARIMQQLHEKSLLARFDEQRPYVYRLSHRSARYLNVDYQLRWHSAAAIHQYLMANRVEVEFRENGKPDFSMVPPVRLLPYGINVAVAEHPARESGQLVLVIIDDYRMKASRINYILSKEHETRNNPEFLDRVRSTGMAVIPTWEKVVRHVHIITTDTGRAPLIEQHLNEMPPSIPWSVTTTEPIWRIA